MFDKFINEDLVITKSPKKEYELISSESLYSMTESVLTNLTSKWLKLAWCTHKESSTDFDWNVLPEVYSFFYGKWYLNTSSNGTVYIKHSWNKTDTVWILNRDSGMIEFNPKGKTLIPEIIKEQSTYIRQG